MPSTACCRPAGNGGFSGWAFTKCFGGTLIASSRPGNVLCDAISLVAFFMKENMDTLLVS